MATKHPFYGYLVVYYGVNGESPRPGAFYVPKYGDTLTKIANSAYGILSSTLSGVQRINKSLWNIQAAEANAFNYRSTSTSCKSKVVAPRKALTTVGYNAGGWLALCPPYPLLWVPSKDGEMPGDLAPPDEGARLVYQPPAAPKGTLLTSKGDRKVTTPRASFVGGPSSSSPYTQAPAKAAASKSGPVAVSQAGFSPWLLLLLAAAAGGGYLWYRSKKKKKRKK